MENLYVKKEYIYHCDLYGKSYGIHTRPEGSRRALNPSRSRSKSETWREKLLHSKNIYSANSTPDRARAPPMQIDSLLRGSTNLNLCTHADAHDTYPCSAGSGLVALAVSKTSALSEQHPQTRLARELGPVRKASESFGFSRSSYHRRWYIAKVQAGSCNASLPPRGDAATRGYVSRGIVYAESATRQSRLDRHFPSLLTTHNDPTR